MINEDFVSFEVAKLLKEKGFNEPCRVFYRDQQAWLYEFKNAPKAYNKDKLFEPCFLAPSLYMTMKWLREEKGTSITVQYCFSIWTCEVGGIRGQTYKRLIMKNMAKI